VPNIKNFVVRIIKNYVKLKVESGYLGVCWSPRQNKVDFINKIAVFISPHYAKKRFNNNLGF